MARRKRRLNARRGRSRRRRNAGYGYNPSHSLSLKSPVNAVKAGFELGTLKKAGVVTGGAVAGGVVTGLLNNYVVGNLMPSFQSNQYAQYAVGLASAGLVGALGGMVAPRYAGDLMTGAVVNVVAKAINDLNIGGVRAFSGMRDFLVQRQVNEARNISGLRDFLVQKQVDAARSLNGMDSDGEFN